MPIVCLTMNPALDLATDVPRVEPGPKLRCGPLRREPGGGGVNVARAVTALGGDALALYAAGGSTGREMDDLLDDAGVPRQRIDLAGSTREDLTVRDTSTGERFRFVLPGPTLTSAEWRRCLDVAAEVAEGPYVVASGSLPPGAPDDFYGRLARILAPRGTRLLLDTSGPALRAALDIGVHLVKPNFRELDEIGGGPPTDAAREEAAAGIVRDGGAEIVIVTLGPAGALMVSADERVRVAAPLIERTDSPVGAGDSFMAGLTIALAGGHPPGEACAVGVAAAAAAMLTPGSELCRRDDVERLLATMPEGPGPGALPGVTAPSSPRPRAAPHR